MTKVSQNKNIDIPLVSTQVDIEGMDVYHFYISHAKIYFNTVCKVLQ